MVGATRLSLRKNQPDCEATMMDQLYDDGGGMGPSAMTQQEPAYEQDAEDRDTQTALLPKSLFAGRDVAPGDIMTVRVVRAHEDELEVVAASESDSAPEESAELAAPALEGGAELYE
jgi:hypothetical protein